MAKKSADKSRSRAGEHELERLKEELARINQEWEKEVKQRGFMEEALQTSLRRLELAYEQVTDNSQELRNEIMQRKRAEEALARSEELRRLQAAQSAREEERKRLAEELHDETMAELVSTALEMGMLARQAKITPEGLDQELDGLRKRLRSTEQGLRQIVQGIYPSVLTNLGLVPALRNFFEHVSSRSNPSTVSLALGLRATGFGEERLPEGVEIVLYRVVQQGVTNTVQHAKASRVQVELDWRESELSMSISDDGVGFDVDHPGETPHTGHFGLVTLKDRIEGLGGSFALESTPSVGTTIKATVPTKSQASESEEEHTARFVLAAANPDSDA